MCNKYKCFSFTGISQTLPSTSYIKMIDVWMIFTMTFLFCEVSLHTAKEILSAKNRAAKGKDI